MAEVLVSGIAEPVSLPMAVIIKSCPVLPGTTESGRKEKAMGGQWDTVGPGAAAAVFCVAEEGEV